MDTDTDTKPNNVWELQRERRQAPAGSKLLPHQNQIYEDYDGRDAGPEAPHMHMLRREKCLGFRGDYAQDSYRRRTLARARLETLSWSRSASLPCSLPTNDNKAAGWDICHKSSRLLRSKRDMTSMTSVPMSCGKSRSQSCQQHGRRHT